MQGKQHHPEGDVLYHLLQCYVLAFNEQPHDEEFQLAALLSADMVETIGVDTFPFLDVRLITLCVHSWTNNEFRIHSNCVV